MFYSSTYFPPCVCLIARLPNGIKTTDAVQKKKGFKQHKLSSDKTKQIKKRGLRNRFKYTRKGIRYKHVWEPPVLPLRTLVQTPSLLCALEGTVFALGNQIWLHTLGVTQRGDDQWGLLVLHSPLFTLENFCYLWLTGRDRCFQQEVGSHHTHLSATAPGTCTCGGRNAGFELHSNRAEVGGGLVFYKLRHKYGENKNNLGFGLDSFMPQICTLVCPPNAAERVFCQQ